MTPEEVKKVKIDLLWELIESWQDARDEHSGEYLHEPRFSFQDIECDFYEKMKEIAPDKRHLKPEKK